MEVRTQMHHSDSHKSSKYAFGTGKTKLEHWENRGHRSGYTATRDKGKAETIHKRSLGNRQHSQDGGAHRRRALFKFLTSVLIA